MSFKASMQAWKVRTTPRNKLVLLALADHANDEYTCFPSVRHLAEKTNLSRSSIQRAIKSLGKECFIKITRRKSGPVTQSSNLYELSYAKILDVLDPLTERQSDTGGRHSDSH